MKKYIYLLTLLPFACNPKEDIAPENPCRKYVQPSADFIMEETTTEFEPYPYYKWYANPYQTKDTIKLSGYYQFRSEFKDTNVYKHTWYIGSELLHNYKEWRDFTDIKPPSSITIHHVIRWKPNNFCNPNETGYDSASFTFKITDRIKELGTFGKYRMVYDTVAAPILQDSVDVELYRCKVNLKDSIIPEPLNSDEYSQFRVKGLYTGIRVSREEWIIVPSNDEPIDRSNYFISSSYARFNAGGLIRYFNIDIDKNNKVFMEYYNYDPHDYRYVKNYKLKGRKINE